MSTFEFFSVALTFVLGLGVARLLVGGLYVFRNRRRYASDWVPVAWAAIIFLLQIQYWWSIFELEALVEIWTQQIFLTLLTLTLLLFVAGALVLPSSDEHALDDLTDYFQENGRWAMVAVSVYSVGTVIANWLLFGASPFSVAGLAVVGAALLPIAAFVAPSRSVRAGQTVAFVIIVAWAYVAMAPGAYG